MANRHVIAGQDSRIRITNRDSIPLGVKYIGKKDKTSEDLKASYSLPDQKRKSWLLLDLETGDNWIPEEDPELQHAIMMRDSFPEGSAERAAWAQEIKSILNAHPAFIRKK